MRRPLRRHCLILLLLLTISQVALAAHSVEHIDFSGGDQVCQLHHARDDHDAVLPESELLPVAVFRTVAIGDTTVRVSPVRFNSPYLARAPPLSH